LADFSQSQAKTKVVCSPSTPRKPLLGHFISSIWVQWVILPCYEGCVWLMLDMPCPLGTAAAGQKFGRYFRFQPELGSKFRRNSFRSRAQNLAGTRILTKTSISFRSFPEFLRSLMLSNWWYDCHIYVTSPSP
jgi:hypothetical protein